MKVLLAAMVSVVTFSAWGYPTGTYKCATQDNSISATWAITTYNATLPYVEVSTNEAGDVYSVQGIGTIETEATDTLIGIPSLDSDGGFFTIRFANDGSQITTGSMICTATGT